MPLTRDQFVQKLMNQMPVRATLNPDPESFLRELGIGVEPCDCDYRDCDGWRVECASIPEVQGL